MNTPFNNIIQNTVRGTRNLINNVRNRTRRLLFSKPSNPTVTLPQLGQGSTNTLHLRYRGSNGTQPQLGQDSTGTPYLIYQSSDGTPYLSYQGSTIKRPKFGQNATSTPPQFDQGPTITWKPKAPTTYFSPAKNVIPQEIALKPNFKENFNESDIVSGNSTYPVVDSNWIPMGVQKSLFTKLFKFKDLRKVQDDISQGNLFLDYKGAVRRDGDRVLTEADFQNVRPATEVLGSKVFNPNAESRGAYSYANMHPHATIGKEKFLGLLNADEAHILAMGGDDIARRIMQNGRPRVLFRRYERTHPLKQQELNEAYKNQQRTPRFNAISVASNTTRNSTNVPFRPGILYSKKITPESNIPIFSGAGNIGNHYNPGRHAIFVRNGAEYKNRLESLSDSGFNENPDLLFDYSVAADAPLLPRTKFIYTNPLTKEISYTYLPFTNDIGQTLSTGTLFHELMHSEMADVNIAPNISKKALDAFIKSKNYIPSHEHFAKFDESGIVFPTEGYATERASELSRANAMMKDVIVNAIRHRVETLAPKKIPGWFNKTPEERAAIIADVTLDLSENTRLANHIMRSWGFEGKDIRIPMSYIKINDPTYMYELLRAAEGIRKTRIPAGKYKPSDLNTTKLITNVMEQFPDEFASRGQIELSKAIQEPGKEFDTSIPFGEAAKQVARNQYNKLFAKTWVQTAPAIAATAVATPYLYRKLASDDQYINNNQYY